MIEPFMQCSNVADSIKFYTEVLDFEIHKAPDPDPTSFDSKHASLQRDGSIVHLSSHTGDGTTGSKIYVRVEAIDALFDQFVSNGLNVEPGVEAPALRGGPVQQTWGMKEFWVADPDGNTVTFGQASD